MAIEWWYWAIGGIVLILLELAIPAFFMIWFGLGALLVAGVLLVAGELSLTAQLLLWTLASLAISLTSSLAAGYTPTRVAVCSLRIIFR